MLGEVDRVQIKCICRVLGGVDRVLIEGVNRVSVSGINRIY